LDLLITEESYGWARRKVTEAKISLAAYLKEPKTDGNTRLVKSLEDAKEALLFLDFGGIGVAQEALQRNLSSYNRLVEYIDGTIAASNLLDGRSIMLYDITSNLVAITEELVEQAGKIWGFDV